MEKVGESPFKGEASFPLLSPPSLLPAHCPTNPSCVAQGLGCPPQGSAPADYQPRRECPSPITMAFRSPKSRAGSGSQSLLIAVDKTHGILVSV